LTHDTMYWSIIGAAFILTGIIAVAIMGRTNKLSAAFFVSLLVCLLITIGGSIWWNGLYEGVQRMFGLFGLWIAFVNIEVLVLFALFIMKKRAG
jgi:hypothetical protein